MIGVINTHLKVNIYIEDMRKGETLFVHIPMPTSLWLPTRGATMHLGISEDVREGKNAKERWR